MTASTADLAEVRRLIASEYSKLEIVAEVPIDGVPALIVYGPATEAIVRTPEELDQRFRDCRRQRMPDVPLAARQRSLF
jgi:hypothetical protein